jgi:hypothetical protein
MEAPLSPTARATIVRVVTVVGEPAWERARSAAGRSAWAHLLRPLAQRIEARAPELAVQIGDHVRGELPELFEDPRALAENRASTEASILVLTELLGRGRAPQLEQLPPAMLAYARESAQQGVPLTSLLRGYRVGFTVLWQEVLAELADLATDRAELGEAVALASAWMFAYADAAQTHTEAFYVTQRERWLRSAVAAQAETLDAILGGRETDAAVAERRLRHALDRHHLGVVAWLDDGDDEEGARRLDAALDELQA